MICKAGLHQPEEALHLDWLLHVPGCRYLEIIQLLTKCDSFPFSIRYFFSFALKPNISFALRRCYNCANLHNTPWMKEFYSILFYSSAEVPTQGRLRSRFTWGYVYMRRIGSPPQSERTSLLLTLSPLSLPPSLPPQYTEPSAVWLPGGSSCVGTEPPCTQLMATVKRPISPPNHFLCINYTSFNCLPPNSDSLGSWACIFFSFPLRSSSSFWCTTRCRQNDTLHTMNLVRQTTPTALNTQRHAQNKATPFIHSYTKHSANKQFELPSANQHLPKSTCIDLA